MVGFGYQQAWLAVRTEDPRAVLDGLELGEVGPVSWRQGVDLAYGHPDRLVVTPPLPGARDSSWVLVAGRWLQLHGNVDVAALSARLATEVQLFVTHRVVELHRWERAVDGVLVRAFGYVGESGELQRWEGDPDEVELAIGLSEEADILVGEQDVMRVAGAWSVDPTSLDGRPTPGPLLVAAPHQAAEPR